MSQQKLQTLQQVRAREMEFESQQARKFRQKKEKKRQKLVLLLEKLWKEHQERRMAELEAYCQFALRGMGRGHEAAMLVMQSQEVRNAELAKQAEVNQHLEALRYSVALQHERLRRKRASHPKTLAKRRKKAKQSASQWERSLTRFASHSANFKALSRRTMIHETPCGWYAECRAKLILLQPSDYKHTFLHSQLFLDKENVGVASKCKGLNAWEAADMQRKIMDHYNLTSKETQDKVEERKLLRAQVASAKLNLDKKFQILEEELADEEIPAAKAERDKKNSMEMKPHVGICEQEKDCTMIDVPGDECQGKEACNGPVLHESQSGKRAACLEATNEVPTEAEINSNENNNGVFSNDLHVEPEVPHSNIDKREAPHHGLKSIDESICKAANKPETARNPSCSKAKLERQKKPVFRETLEQIGVKERDPLFTRAQIDSEATENSGNLRMKRLDANQCVSNLGKKNKPRLLLKAIQEKKMPTSDAKKLQLVEKPNSDAKKCSARSFRRREQPRVLVKGTQQVGMEQSSKHCLGKQRTSKEPQLNNGSFSPERKKGREKEEEKEARSRVTDMSLMVRVRKGGESLEGREHSARKADCRVKFSDNGAPFPRLSREPESSISKTESSVCLKQSRGLAFRSHSAAQSRALRASSVRGQEQNKVLVSSIMPPVVHEGDANNEVNKVAMELSNLKDCSLSSSMDSQRGHVECKPVQSDPFPCLMESSYVERECETLLLSSSVSDELPEPERYPHETKTYFTRENKHIDHLALKTSNTRGALKWENAPKSVKLLAQQVVDMMSHRKLNILTKDFHLQQGLPGNSTQLGSKDSNLTSSDNSSTLDFSVGLEDNGGETLVEDSMQSILASLSNEVKELDDKMRKVNFLKGCVDRGSSQELPHAGKKYFLFEEQYNRVNENDASASEKEKIQPSNANLLTDNEETYGSFTFNSVSLKRSSSSCSSALDQNVEMHSDSSSSLLGGLTDEQQACLLRRITCKSQAKVTNSVDRKQSLPHDQASAKDLRRSTLALSTCSSSAGSLAESNGVFDNWPSTSFLDNNQRPSSSSSSPSPSCPKKGTASLVKSTSDMYLRKETYNLLRASTRTLQVGMKGLDRISDNATLCDKSD